MEGRQGVGIIFCINRGKIKGNILDQNDAYLTILIYDSQCEEKKEPEQVCTAGSEKVRI